MSSNRDSQLRRPISGLLVLLTGLLLVPVAASADTTEIDQWGAVITKKGDYKLTANLTAPGSGDVPPAIRIENCKDVKLDLNGKTITGRPHPTDSKMGLGNGIQASNVEDLEIEGSGGSITRCQIAIRISQCKEVKVDGEQLFIHHNSHGLQAYNQTGKIEIKDIRLANQKYLDCMLQDVKDGKVKDTLFVGGSQTGIWLANCDDVDVEDCRLGTVGPLTYGIVVKNSKETDIRKCDLGRCQTAITLMDPGTKDTEIKDNDFGEPADNNCDLRVANGAEEPDLDDNEPDDLTRCETSN
jgi:hypothetical protein